MIKAGDIPAFFYDMLILGIETSCDETSAAVVKDGREIVSSIILSQDALHRQFGGVVPEIACRAHLESIIGIVNNALSDAKVSLAEIDAIAVVRTLSSVSLSPFPGPATSTRGDGPLPSVLAINHL